MSHTLSAQTQTPRTPREIPTLATSQLFGWLNEFRSDPLALMTRARQAGDLIRMRLGPRFVLVVNEPAYIQTVLQDHHRNFTKDTRVMQLFKYSSGENIFTGEGEFWLKRRRLMQPMFHRQVIASFGGIMTQTANEMLAQWDAAPKNEPLAIDREMTRVTLKIVGRALFSVDLAGDMRELGEAFALANDDLAFRIQHPFYPPPFIPTPRNRRSNAARKTTEQIILRIIRKRIAPGENNGDLLSLLMSMRDEETGKGLSEQELYREALVMLFAGHDTTSNALTWAWYFLSQHPEAEQKLQAEADAVLQGRAPAMDDVPQLIYTRRVLDETMRLAPPAWITSRASVEADTLGEYAVPAQTPVLISPYAMHRHPRYWKNPDAFDPDRFAPENLEKQPRFVYMPFGGGPRICIGQPFALAEATLLLAAVAQRYALRLAPNAHVVAAPRITLGMANALPMSLHAR